MINRHRMSFRVHFVFAGGIASILLIGLVTNISAGQSFAPALWHSISEIRLMEWGMIIIFWYGLTFPPNVDGWNNRYRTSLGLSEPK